MDFIVRLGQKNPPLRYEVGEAMEHPFIKNKSLQDMNSYNSVKTSIREIFKYLT
jgi:serine/threonine protein kinase